MSSLHNIGEIAARYHARCKGQKSTSMIPAIKLEELWITC